jgi:hypothetical protein
LKDGQTQEIGANHSDPGDGALYRTVHALAINNTITPNATTVAHVRLGYTSFADDCVPVAGFDPGTLGFSSSFVSQVPVKKFPYFAIGSYGTDYNGYMFGERPINNLRFRRPRWRSHSKWSSSGVDVGARRPKRFSLHLQRASPAENVTS